MREDMITAGSVSASKVANALDILSSVFIREVCTMLEWGETL
jgi:hypothetical protein